MSGQNNADPFGEAVKDYFKNKWKASKLLVESSISEPEKISPSYLFRDFRKMPPIEQEALKSCNGKILDVGACAGSHSLYLQEKDFDVTAIDISEGCCEIMSKRGIKKVECINFYDLKDQSYDTILLLMNGIGIAGTLRGLTDFLNKAKSLLAPNGRIIFDSSDIDYAFYEEDGSKWVNLNSDYYGEVQYTTSYKAVKGETFNWLFVDTNTISDFANACGFTFKILKEGSHHDYLGELRVLENKE